MNGAGVKVAVVGARGVGKHHAKWYALSGCDVVAFVGTSEESCRATEKTLRDLFGFQGRGYWDLGEMLTREQPDIVDVCSPNERHKEHVLRALDFGAGVMCEKPLVWDTGKSGEEILADGREIVDRAGEPGRTLGLCTQYAASLRPYLEMYEQARGPMGRIERVYGEMDSVARNGGKAYEEIWIDLASHPLSFLLVFLPEGELDSDTIECVVEHKENRVRFDYVSRSGRCAVEIVLRNLPKGAAPVRRFGVNDFLVAWEGRPDDSGVYRAYLKHGDEETCCEDFMHTLLNSFASHIAGTDGQVLVTGETALRNLELQVEVLEKR